LGDLVSQVSLRTVQAVMSPPSLPDVAKIVRKFYPIIRRAT